ncbi:MAG TPA: hypothetical protein HPP83_03520 [Candidatus Hydrogenedentes bacterium]|nr:hypothetical protein [Candidatus Hydrogenedentota bacterium]
MDSWEFDRIPLPEIGMEERASEDEMMGVVEECTTCVDKLEKSSPENLLQ